MSQMLLCHRRLSDSLIKSLAQLSSSSPIKSESPLTLVSSSPFTVSRRGETSKRENNEVPIKDEPFAASIPRKRLSDVAFRVEKHEAEDPSAIHKNAKKSKTVVTSKTPLVPVTNTASVSEGLSLDKRDSFSRSIGLQQHPREQLDNIRVALIGQQTLLERIRAKSVKTAQDRERAKMYEAELCRLQELEQQYFMSSLASSSSTPFNTYQPFLFKSEPLDDQRMFDQWQGVAEPFPMDLDIDPYAPSTSTAGAQFPGPSRYPSPNPFLLQSDSTHVAHDIKPVVQFNDAIASTSKVTQKAGSSYLPVPPNVNNAHASGSNQPQPPGGHPDMTDDDDYSDDDSHEYNLPDTSGLVNRMGFKLPPPIADDARDSNGDYYGRGRDLFEGPRAAHDE